jgi:NitT/TauT family transport system permease protein
MLFEPLKPVSRGARTALGTIFFLLFIAAWWLVTWAGVIDAMFLKTPLETLVTG